MVWVLVFVLRDQDDSDVFPVRKQAYRKKLNVFMFALRSQNDA